MLIIVIIFVNKSVSTLRGEQLIGEISMNIEKIIIIKKSHKKHYIINYKIIFLVIILKMW